MAPRTPAPPDGGGFPAAPTPASAPRPVDLAALSRLSVRLHAALEAPWLHAEVGRRMADRLSIIRAKPAQVLDWGSFLGASRVALAQAYPGGRITAVEADPARRQAAGAARRGSWWSPARWGSAASAALAPQAVPPGSAQLVWSNMALHGEADPQALMVRWHAALQTDGFLMFSTLGPGTLAPLRMLYQQHGFGPPFAPFVDMHDLGDMLVHAGFADPVMDQETLTLTWADGRAALNELRGLGGNAASGRHPGLRTPRWQRRLEALLEATCAQGGRVALPFEIVYGHAFKPLPRHRVAAQTAIAVEDLRAMARAPRRSS